MPEATLQCALTASFQQQMISWSKVKDQMTGSSTYEDSNWVSEDVSDSSYKCVTDLS